MHDFDPDTIALIASVGVVIALVAPLYIRIGILERRIQRLTDLTRRWWLWAQKVIVLYHLHRRRGAPDLPPIPTEEDTHDS